MPTMSLEYFVPGEGPAELLDRLSVCIATAGTNSFNAHFLALIARLIRADQCMIFSYRTDRPVCYLSYNERHSRSAQNLAQRYLREGFSNDPLLAQIEAVRQTQDTRIIDLDEIRPAMSEQYLETFFLRSGIVDKIAVIAANSADVICMSFYRYEESGRFHRSDAHVRQSFWKAIAAIALLHYSSALQEAGQSPLDSLSGREKNICEAMLRGLTSDAIAWEMKLSSNTVKTYRRRAYEKLGINSKSALFEVCRRR